MTPEDDVAALRAAFPTRIALISPPRTGSTPVARLLWQHSAVSHHCHEPFEGRYWAEAGSPLARPNLGELMAVDTGERTRVERVPAGAGVLVKEMSFQLDTAEFALLAGLVTVPVVFVVRDPRLATTSRLRVVGELYDASTFPPFESGWPSLAAQVRRCADLGVPHVVVDSGDLRADPDAVVPALLDRLGLAREPGLGDWKPRPGLELCAPEVGALMSERRRRDDPFYRRVLGSTGVQPPDEVDWAAEEAAIRSAGLSEAVAEWLATYTELRTGDAALALPAGPKHR